MNLASAGRQIKHMLGKNRIKILLHKGRNGASLNVLFSKKGIYLQFHEQGHNLIYTDQVAYNFLGTNMSTYFFGCI